jgi:hypothetical protein
LRGRTDEGALLAHLERRRRELNRRDAVAGDRRGVVLDDGEVVGGVEEARGGGDLHRARELDADVAERDGHRVAVHQHEPALGVDDHAGANVLEARHAVDLVRDVEEHADERRRHALHVLRPGEREAHRPRHRRRRRRRRRELALRPSPRQLVELVGGAPKPRAVDGDDGDALLVLRERQHVAHGDARAVVQRAEDALEVGERRRRLRGELADDGAAGDAGVREHVARECGVDRAGQHVPIARLLVRERVERAAAGVEQRRRRQVVQVLHLDQVHLVGAAALDERPHLAAHDLIQQPFHLQEGWWRR